MISCRDEFQLNKTCSRCISSGRAASKPPKDLRIQLLSLPGLELSCSKAFPCARYWILKSNGAQNVSVDRRDDYVQRSIQSSYETRSPRSDCSDIVFSRLGGFQITIFNFEYVWFLRGCIAVVSIHHRTHYSRGGLLNPHAVL